MPSVRGLGALPAVESALALTGFSSVTVIVGGKSCSHDAFVQQCRQLTGDVRLTASMGDKIVLPGEARNRCLDILEKDIPDVTHVLFLDDDIVAPEDFGTVLVDFLEKEKNVVAAMGRVVSAPKNYWNRLIDYTTFWWLQVRRNIPNLGWLGGGATMVRYRDIEGLEFDETLMKNEDTFFFKEVARRSGGTLGICAETSCLHYHGRATMKDVLHYQYINGKNSKHEFHASRLNLKAFFIGLRNMAVYAKRAFGANWKYLLPRPHLAFGVLTCILINGFGLYIGIYQSGKSKAPSSQLGVQGEPPPGAPRAGAPGGPPEAIEKGARKSK